MLTSGIITLLGLNVINPEARTVDANITHHPNGTIWLADQVSADGVTVILDRINEFPLDVQEQILPVLCARNSEFSEWSGLSYNRSEAAAFDVISDACGS